MPSHFKDAQFWSFPFYRGMKMLPDYFKSLFKSRRRQMFSCCKKMFYLSEKPGITNRCSSNHDSINTISVFIFQCFFWGVYISISKNGNMHSWVVFHFCNPAPIGFSFIKLTSGSAVNGQSLYTNILQAFCYFYNIDTIKIPAESRFYSHRNGS